MTIQDIQVSSLPQADDRTASRSFVAILREWLASYGAQYAPKAGSTTIDASSQLSCMPVR